jgi:tRNA dimethylallyltransferase
MLVRFPVIVGPTAGGKSTLAVALAHALRSRGCEAHVVTADSMQVFRGMDIGTAKPTPEERAGVPHHLIGVVEPAESFSVDRWLALANPLIDDLRERDIMPIVVGGTHLYAKALLEGLFEGPAADQTLRDQLASLSAVERREELARVDPEATDRIHPNDDRRTIRALEVFRLTGRPISEHQREWDTGRVRDDALLVGLSWPIEALNRRINARVLSMMEAGLEAEARTLWEADMLGPQARQALGYKQLIAHFERRCSLAEAIERIKIETRRFAKNQRTWLRRLRTTPGSVWLEAEQLDAQAASQRIADDLLAPEEHGKGDAAR